MKANQWIFLSCAAIAFSLVGCASEDTPVAASDNDEWEFNNSETPDSGSDVGTADGGLDADLETGVGADVAGANNDPNLPPLPEGVVPEALIGTTWSGIFRFTTDPAITGVYLSVSFEEDKVVLRNDAVREGKWTITEEGDVYLFELENEPPQFLLLPDLDTENRIRSLDLSIPAFGTSDPYRLKFERRGTSAVPIDELRGRWQADRLVTNEHGTFRMALRIGVDDFVEIGIVNQGNFFGISNGDGATHTFLSGRHFLTIHPSLDAEHPSPIAGEVLGDGEERRIYLFSQEGEGEAAVLVPLAFRAVTHFESE